MGTMRTNVALQDLAGFPFGVWPNGNVVGAMYDKTTALGVAEYLLDCSGKALEDGDFERFLTCFDVPHRIETFTGVRVLDSREAMERTFNDVLEYRRNHHVTDVIRRVVSARFVDEDTVNTSHETRMLCGSFQIQESFLTLSEAKRRDGIWKLTFSQYAIPDAPQLSTALSGPSSYTPQSGT